MCKKLLAFALVYSNKRDKNLVCAPLGNTGVTHTMKSLNSVENKGETANLKQF